MKKFSILFLVAIFVINTAIMPVLAYSENNVLKSENIEKYITSEGDFQKRLTDWLDEVNSLQAVSLNGKISVLEPFSLPLFSPLENKYYQEKENVMFMYAPVVCENVVVGLAMFNLFGDNQAQFSRVYYLSENSDRELDNGICFCCIADKAEPVSEKVTSGGIAQFGIVSVNANDKVSFSYYDASSFYRTEERNDLYDSKAIMNNTPTFENLSKYCCVDSDTKVIYSFDYKNSGDEKIVSGKKYYFQNKYGKYLNYSDGKYSLSAQGKTAFIIKSEENGSFTISPEAKPQSRMAVKGTNTFFMNLSNFNGYCYSICKSDNTDVRLTAKEDTVVFSDINSPNVKVSSMDWYIIRA